MALVRYQDNMDNRWRLIIGYDTMGTDEWNTDEININAHGRIVIQISNPRPCPAPTLPTTRFKTIFDISPTDLTRMLANVKTSTPEKNIPISLLGDAFFSFIFKLNPHIIFCLKIQYRVNI